MNVRNILVAYDGSESSKSSMKYSEFLAGMFGAKIFSIHVYSLQVPINPYYATYLLEVSDKIKNRYRREFEEMSGEMEKKGIEFQSDVLEGEIEAEIAKYADKIDADIIITGITPRGFLGSMLIESVSIKLLRRTHRPVLIPKGLDVDETNSIGSILVPLDVGDKMHEALDAALMLAERENADITVLYVLNISLQIYEVPDKILTEIIEEVKNDLKVFVDDHVKERINQHGKYKGINIDTKVIFGMSPASKAAEYARENDIDLIVVNSYGKGALKRLLLGSTAEQIVRDADRPVLVVKPELRQKSTS